MWAVFVYLDRREASNGARWSKPGAPMTGECFLLSICVCQNSRVEILMPNVVVLEGSTFGRGLGHESGTITNGTDLCLCRKRPHKDSLPLPPGEDTARSQQSATPERVFTRIQSCSHPDLGLPSSRMVRNEFLLCKRPLVCDIL